MYTHVYTYIHLKCMYIHVYSCIYKNDASLFLHTTIWNTLWLGRHEYSCVHTSICIWYIYIYTYIHVHVYINDPSVCLHPNSEHIILIEVSLAVSLVLSLSYSPACACELVGARLIMLINWHACTAYCIWSIISSISNLIRCSTSLGLFGHVPLKRDQGDWDWRLGLNDTPNAIGCMYA